MADDFATGYALGSDSNCNNSMFGGDGWWAIIIFALIFGWGRGGYGGFGDNGGAAGNYVLSSDFATLQRQIDSSSNSLERKLDGVNNGLCDGFYTQAQLVNSVNANIAQANYDTQTAINGIGSQLASCCCDIREGISGINYNIATTANGIERQIERGFCDTNYNMATHNCQTLQAIDKVGDRIIDYMNQQTAQALRDENQALRLAASQQAQNNYIVNALRTPAPVPAYCVPNPCGCGCNSGCC